MFFNSAKDREGSYEAQLKKASLTTTKPSKVETTKKSESTGGDSFSFLGLLGGIVESIGGKFLPIIATAGALAVSLLGLKTVIEGIYNWFASTSVGKSMGLKPTEGAQVEKNGYSQSTNSFVDKAAGIGGAVDRKSTRLNSSHT